MTTLHQDSWDQYAAVAERRIAELTAENERLRAIVRVNGLRWGHSHAEIDELLNQQQGSGK